MIFARPFGAGFFSTRLSKSGGKFRRFCYLKLISVVVVLGRVLVNGNYIVAKLGRGAIVVTAGAKLAANKLLKVILLFGRDNVVVLAVKEVDNVSASDSADGTKRTQYAADKRADANQQNADGYQKIGSVVGSFIIIARLSSENDLASGGDSADKRRASGCGKKYLAKAFFIIFHIFTIV